MSAPELVERYFRHEYGRLVASLTRRVGVRHLELVEDAAQSALLTALATWTATGPPDNPSAWVFRVAERAVAGELRKTSNQRRVLQERIDPRVEEGAPEAFLADEMQDDLLRMLFVCCDEALPVESRLVLALKTLSGLSVREIALRLFTSEGNVHQRLSRARRRLAEVPPELDVLSPSQIRARVPAVQRIVYLLFTEGHLSAEADAPIRRELCDEAIRLGTLLAAHALGRTPETAALLALMHLHKARTTAREDPSGGLVLLEDQDRAQWDVDQIHLGLEWLEESARGDVFSRYHAEAGIAAEHCLAPSFRETRWDRVVDCYALLERTAPSPLHTLNRAVAVAEWQGPAAGLAVIEGMAPPTWLTGSYLWSSVLADLHRRRGDAEAADRYRRLALASAPSAAVRALLERRLGS